MSSVEFNNETIESIKSVKLYTKIDNSTFDHVNNQWVKSYVNGPAISLTVKVGNKFVGNLSEGDIKVFGKYDVDRIEIILNKGTKKVSYYSKCYTSLGENDKENGELIQYTTL